MRLFRNPNIKEIRGEDCMCDECGSTKIEGDAWEFDLDNYVHITDVVPLCLCFDCVKTLLVTAADAVTNEHGRLTANWKKPARRKRPFDLDRALAAEDYGDPDDTDRSF